MPLKQENHCATVSTVKKYRGTRYYRDGTVGLFAKPENLGVEGDGP